VGETLLPKIPQIFGRAHVILYAYYLS